MLFSAPSRFLLLASVAAIAVLGFAGSAAAGERSLAAAAPQDTLSRALASGQATDAQYALQRALAILAPGLASPRYSSAAKTANPREATLALRDLAARVGSLSRSERRLAARLLARPTDGASEGPAGYVGVRKSKRKHFCTTRFCIHWVTSGSERPSLVDKNHNRKPDYIDKTIRTMNTVWKTEIRSYGYKKPRPDGGSGSHHGGNPNKRIDIFIANIGDRGLYGYCTTDDPLTNRSTHRQTSAYCVFDNDFKLAEFSSGAHGLAALKVTAAHEFFHAIQFAYDLFEDRAWMEGTATWMEDEVFTNVNDNIQYLLNMSPVDPENDPDIGSGPWIALDAGRQSTQYGTWIWYRFLSEVHGDAIIKQFWVRAVGKSYYGFKAQAAILAARGTSLTAMLAQFGYWNTSPASFYIEGALYPAAGAIAGGDGVDSTLEAGQVVPWDFGLFHFSNDYLLFTPGAATSTLSLTIDFPPGVGAASAVWFGPAGEVHPLPITLDGNGNGVLAVPFSSALVSKVVVVMTNAGGRFTCNRGKVYSCSGIPLDDFLGGGFKVTAHANP